MLVEELIDKINILISELKLSEETNVKFRINSYLKVINVLESNFPTEIQITLNMIDKLPITDYMKGKLKSFMNGKSDKSVSDKSDKSVSDKSDKNTVDTKVVDTIDDKKTNALLSQLIAIHGIGMERAKQLIKAGVTSLKQLRSKKIYMTLPEETKMFLKLKPMKEIPNDYIKKLEPSLLSLSDKEMLITLVGSYRRKKPISSDIDVMIISDVNDSIDTFLSKLTSKFTSVFPYSKGNDKLSVIVDISNVIKIKDVVVKIDAFRVNKKEEIPMLLYSTGSKTFNIRMRSQAKKKGYLLNQHGLFLNGELVPGLKTEEDYFKILQMDYLKPEERL